MELKKDNVLKYFSDLRAHYAAYHNHKETSAWVASALYLGGILQLAGSMATNALLVERVVRGSIILLLAFLGYKYISTQFKMRRDAANYVAACLVLSLEYLSIDENEIKGEWFKTEEQGNSESHSPLVLPKIILEKVRVYATAGQQTRTYLENSVIYSLTILTVVALLAVAIRQ